MVSKQPVMISFDSSTVYSATGRRILFLNMGMYLSKGDNGEFGGISVR